MKTAHAHILSVLWTELRRADLLSRPISRPLRILDIGCGYGGFIEDLLQDGCRRFGCDRSVSVYGYEVYDHRGATPGFETQVVERLSKQWPEEPWSERIRLGSAGEPWPYDDAFFDVAISNQVVEHVRDLEVFFAEQARAVMPGGIGIHFFPAKGLLVEPHSGVPFAHWVARGNRERWIRALSRVGIGKYRRYRRERGSDVRGFAREFNRYLERYVFFRSTSEVWQLARQATAESGFGYGVPLSRRALVDDWGVFPYREAQLGRSAGWLAAFAPVTLVQRF